MGSLKNIKVLKKKLSTHPSILCERHYIKTSILIPILVINNEYHLLFQERSENIKQGSEICFPGGKFDSKNDNTDQDTAIRETVEELGIKKEKIELLGQFDTLVHHMGMIVNTFIATLNINSLDELNIDKNEVKRIFTLPISFFKNNKPEEYKVRIEATPFYIDENGNKILLLPVKELGLPDKYLTPWGNSNHKVIVYKTEQGTVWGMTAKIVHEFIDFFMNSM